MAHSPHHKRVERLGTGSSIVYSLLIPLFFFSIYGGGGSPSNVAHFFLKYVWPVITIAEIILQVLPMIESSYAHTKRTTIDQITSFLPIITWGMTMAGMVILVFQDKIKVDGNGSYYLFISLLGAVAEIVLVLLLPKLVATARQEADVH